jgi:hypothetical protein
MAKIRSVDFLPEIFRTDTNKQFLGATLDTLIQEPAFTRKQGYIGRTIGPGVNPEDYYVIEPNQTRADYQLEPSVVSLKPDTDEVQDVMTYPGFADAISFQGGNGVRSDRLYDSDYYTWDPFVDFDSFVNFGQYYWLPNGPDAVTVGAVEVAATNNFIVNRTAGTYRFNGIPGNNPIIELVRGGTYTFRVDQNAKQTIEFRVGNEGTRSYVIDGQGNPTLTLTRGNTYVFNLNLTGDFPFWIKTTPSTGTNNVYDPGVTNNGAISGVISFVVPQDAPDTLYYAAENQSNMQGVLQIIDAEEGTGPGFWIQTEPGVTGRIGVAPNISSRDVFGVNNNGLDVGSVIFNVPTKTAQQFYYDLPEFSTPIDLITTLKFNQVNNQPLEEFLARHGGIDGVRNLQNRTLIFTEPLVDAEAGGWISTTLFDPLPQSALFNGQIGSYDSLSFDQTTPVPLDQRYQLYTISYTNSNGVDYITLSRSSDIPVDNKFTIRYGTQYSNTQWYKNTSGRFEQIPLLSAIQDTLYYQDGLDPNIFGTIKLLDAPDSSTLFINNILGQQSYTSPNGVEFTNGLKVIFTGNVFPESYSTGTVPITCSSTSAQFNTITTDSTAVLYTGQQVVFSSPTLGGLVAGRTYYVQAIINNFQFTVSETADGLPVQLQNGTGTMNGTAINYREYYVEGVGESIELLPVQDLITPETYVAEENQDGAAIPTLADYITVQRSALNNNAWSRSNRWFHIQVIDATAEYNGTEVNLNNESRAKRPILQFRGGLKLFNMGTFGKRPIDVIDFSSTDAFSQVQGAVSYTVDGYALTNGARVIFAADSDSDVSNKIFQVEFIVPDSSPVTLATELQVNLRYIIVDLGTTDWNAVAGTTGVTYAVGDAIVVDAVGTGTGTARYAQPVINLTQTSDGAVLVDSSTFCLRGNTLKGKTFWYDGIEWKLAQQKTARQQAPLFDIYDSTGLSYSNEAKYPSSNFMGTRLFGYSVVDDGIDDVVLGFPLEYLNIDNVGDIVFKNYFYTDQFVYTRDNVSVSLPISDGFGREYSSRTQFQRLLGWQKAATTSQVYQQFKFVYESPTLQIDIPASSGSVLPSVKVFVGASFLDPGNYSYEILNGSTVITLNQEYTPGEIIEVLVLSDQPSALGFYQVPSNLQSNPLNANASQFTLGTVRTHYQSICQNLSALTGSIIGSNNTRDLGNIGIYGGVILQQSSPLTMAGYFLRSKQFNVFDALGFNSREYLKIKNLILDSVTQQDIQFNTPAQILDTALANITEGRVESQPFYWSDMLPWGAVYQQTVYNISFITTAIFDTRQTYDYTTSNYRGLNVYLNDQLLTRDIDYQVATDGPRITVLVTLSVGDVLTLREFSSTVGSFVPNTPSKMGLYPKWVPEIIIVKTTSGSEQVIRGHDGSLTKLFGDIRDDVLLEFEKRIYNNIKLDGNPLPLSATDVIPGQFRSTGYSTEEIQNILNVDFLSYVAWNKLDYRTQDYNVNNEFTFNYSNATNRIDDGPLHGAWRGIYRFFYDTEQPELSPWEMLGFTTKPDWWESRYGTAPYTADNLVLWEDLEAGLVTDPNGSYVLPAYRRPGLTRVIPVDSQGQLLSPLQCVVESFDSGKFRQSWSLGDGSPVEASWFNSSAYPFAVMRLLALTRPAKFFALFADRDLYRLQTEFDQYLYDGRYRLDANGVQVYGDGTSKASFTNWIVDYNRLSGLNSTDILTDDLANLDVRLCYRMASYSDKRYIKLYTEKASPDSQNVSFLIPDESYDLVLYKNQNFERLAYSAVIIQQSVGGYSVFGYSTSQPFFPVQQGQLAGKLDTVTTAGLTVRVPVQYTDNVNLVPYGTVFANRNAVANFLLGYGNYLERQGLVFDNFDNGYQLNWIQMVSEFLYWSQQGWETDAIIVLNPLADRLSVTKEQSVVDSIRAQTEDRVLLDQNRREVPTRNVNIVRLDNTFGVSPLNEQTLNYVDLQFTSYEHLMIIDNRSVFGDLIYEPTTGARQSRLRLAAATTSDWNGTLDTQGFILNQDNVQEWSGDRTYSKGEIVLYKQQYWSSLGIVQPSQEFNFNEWVLSDYESISKGLLPNLATKADQLVQSYNINVANLESDSDLLSYGLIAFRPRQYMTALELDDVSQVNIYRQFLGDKGTIRSAELFSQANLGKESAEYQIYENWAIQRAIYGANANRSFFEIRLDKSLLSANPSLIQIVEPQEASKADQTVLLSDLWRESYRIPSPAILPTTFEQPTDVSLPTAGYVNLEDVDITIFDINADNALAEQLNNIQDGTIIWAAKVNDYDWNIYRAQALSGHITHICDNLDQTSLVAFTQPHGLSVGDKVIIRFFDADIDGVYDVLTVVGLDKITIDYTFVGIRTVINGTGIAFTLQTMRVPQVSDIIDLPYANTVVPGARAWVDNNGSGQWELLEKQEVFETIGSISPTNLKETENYASAVTLAKNKFAALVGAPGYYTNLDSSEIGAVYVYIRGFANTYQPISPTEGDAVLTLENPAIRTYGNTITFGDTEWAAAGASGSLAVLPSGALISGNDYIIKNVGNTDWLSIGATASAVVTGSISGLELTVAAVTSGLPQVGSYIYGAGIAAGTYITKNKNAVGGIGVFYINQSQTVGSVTISAIDPGVEFTATGAALGTGTAMDKNSVHGYAAMIYKDADGYLPGTNPYSNWQILNNALAGAEYGGEFGYSMSMSDDERWLYVGAPGINRVYAYARRDWQNQRATFLGDGSTRQYNFEGLIQISRPTQIEVAVDNTMLDDGVDYDVTSNLGGVIFASAPANGAQIRIQRINAKQLDFETYLSVAGSNGIGSGSGARLTVVRRRNTLDINVLTGGTGYNTNDTIIIDGEDIWGLDVDGNPVGSSSANDVTVTINATSGVVTSIQSIEFAPPPLVNIFSLGEFFATATDIYSFSVTVDGVLQIPGVDYDYNADNSTIGQDIVFYTHPPTDSTIIVTAKNNWVYCDTITVDGLNVDARFGASVSTTTDGRQVLIGAPDATVDGETSAGAVYVFDRNVQRFVYGRDDSLYDSYWPDTSSPPVFTLLGDVNAPVSVTVNGQYYINQADSVVNAENSFVVSGNTVTLNGDLVIGDDVEISSNQFALVQTLAENDLAEFSNFGQALDLCSYNCSLYVGAPQSSSAIYKGGIVQRHVNQSRLYGTITSTITAGNLTAGHTLRVNDIDVEVLLGNATLSGLAQQINLVVPNVTAQVQNGLITIFCTNPSAAPIGNLLRVSPGSVGTIFADLGFETFYFTQTIASPTPREFAAFGSALTISTSATELVVGAPNDNMYLVTIFDDGDTDFDGNATVFFSEIEQSGAVYLYAQALATNASITNPNKFIIGQQIAVTDASYLDRLGSTLDYRDGLLWIGSPGSDLGDSNLANFGRALIFLNENQESTWKTVRIQSPTVDVSLLNSVFLYDVFSSVTSSFLDFFNPLQGKILGVARQNIDYIGAVDPASYNTGLNTSNGSTWSNRQIGEIWWDTSAVRFIDPNQDDIVYASRRWGQIFPGSQVNIYQWTESTQPPSDYVGEGEPLNFSDYVTRTVLGSDNVFETLYYFWVRGKSSIDLAKGKTLSAESISLYIADPRSSGIPYAAPIDASTISLYNCESFIESTDTILHVEFDQQLTSNNIHVEYELLAQDRADGWISDRLYRKLLDSFCGVDTAGNRVPDLFLSPPERYGVQFRPRQSMFVDRFGALKNYIDRSNAILAQYPISEIRSFDILNSSDPEPTAASGLWNEKVPSLEILLFQNLSILTLPYAYLVESDSTQNGRWTIYSVEQVGATRRLQLSRVQNFVTSDYWNYINWYLPGYNQSIKPILEVQNSALLSTLSVTQVPVGSSVKVTANSQGKFEIYLRNSDGFERVGLEDGTIAISTELYDYSLGRFGFDTEVFDAQYFDQEPVIETRQILEAINKELFIDDLLIERNRLLVLMFNYILTESTAPEWLVKTSLIDVDHRIRELLPFQNYNRDNQEFVIDYIQEVKPYRTQVREFNLQYFGSDTYNGDISDFDIPAYFNTGLEVPRFTSPILLPYKASTVQISNNLSDAPESSVIWNTWPYSQWFANYELTLDSILVTSPGSGYTEAPQVVISGDADTNATAVARISNGILVAVDLIDAGSGYRDAPVISFQGGNGSGAAAYPRMVNSLIRQFKTTIKYDRCQYRTSILTWTANVIYQQGDRVRYNDQVYEALITNSSSTFVPENWQEVPAGELSGIDRTMGFYVPGVNSPGLDLPLLVDGIDYPGVQVWGNYFSNGYALDVVYRNAFTDQYVGTRPTDINVVGGEFIGLYEGHAPEELVNGSEFDTLDIRVYTRPGSDWQGDGHGFQIAVTNFEFDALLMPTHSWAGLVENPVQVLVSNQTTGLDLTPGVDYDIDWIAQTVTPDSNRVDSGDVISIAVTEAGGGRQLYRSTFDGTEYPSGIFNVPVNAAEILSIAVFFDGVYQINVPTWVPFIDSQNWNILDSYDLSDIVNNAGTYYRAIQSVPIGINITDTDYWQNFVPTLESRITLGVPPAATDLVSVLVFGATTINAGDFIVGRSYTISSIGNTDWIDIGASSVAVGETFTATGLGSGTGQATTDYSWSAPEVQYKIINATDILNGGFELTGSMQGSNPVNSVITRSGRRLSPPAGIEWIGDGTSTSFGLPQRLGESFLQSTINALNDIQVRVDDVLYAQSFGSVIGDYSVTNWDGSNTPGRQVVFNNPPADGARILITVSTLADYEIVDDFILFNSPISINDNIIVTSWNDTSQQNILTEVFIGPVNTGIVVEESYDSIPFDLATSSFSPGSYDYASGAIVQSNSFILERPTVDPQRLWVTLDGIRLFDGQDYIIQNNQLILSAGTISTSQILVVTQFTDSIVPEASAFRIFQDMRGVQAVYRITSESSTVLAQPLGLTDEKIYVTDVLTLSEPSLTAGIFGVVSINGERITYRSRNLADNSISGLMRGTAGTAIDEHDTGSIVTNIGRANLLPEQYQDFVISGSATGDGSTTLFYFDRDEDDPWFLTDDSVPEIRSLEVYVGGARADRVSDDSALPESSIYKYEITDYDPLAIMFVSDSAVPPPGVEIKVVQRRGYWWYDVSTATTRDLSLQESNTFQARFLTGR